MRLGALLGLALGCGPAPTPPGACCEVVVERPTQPAYRAIGPRSPLRRLTRVELDNALVDLVGLGLPDGLVLPGDARTDGFDNQAAALTLSPVWIEAVHGAVADVVLEATTPPLPSPYVLDLWPEDLAADAPAGNGVEDSVMVLRSAGAASAVLRAPQAGRWTLRWTVAGAGAAVVTYSVTVDGRVASTGVVSGRGGAPTVLDVDVTLPEDAVQVSISLDDDGAADGYDLDLLVYGLSLRSPEPFDSAPSAAWTQLIPCDLLGEAPRACVEVVLDRLAPRAWRRPLADDERERLLGVYDGVVAEGEEPLVALRVALRAVLMSPSFLAVWEPDAPPGSRADGYTIASRLSFFLWQSVPDDLLLAAAAAGELDDDEGVAASVERMLAWPRARSLASGLLAQWTWADRLSDVTPSLEVYPDFSVPLRRSMYAELDALLMSFVPGEADRSLMALLTSDVGYVDPTLAAHLGLPGPENGLLSPYDAAAAGRPGLMGTAGWQTVTSMPNRTSPVRRGVWVLDNLLCAAPPPPVAVVPLPTTTEPRSQRELLEAHRADPACAVCHDRIDPIGLALEGFDAVGAPRSEDGGVPVDVRVTLEDGRSVEGLTGLAEALDGDPAVVACLARKVFLWGARRPPSDVEEQALVDQARAAGPDGLTLRALARIVATSPAITRVGAEEAP